MKPFYFFVFFWGLLAVGRLQGQETADTLLIPEVKVIAGRKIQEAGLKMTRPDSVQRSSALTSDLSQLVAAYSPVFIKSYGLGAEATASFRGTAATHTQVLWNGMNINSPMRGISDLALLPVFFTDDVYLLHGGSSMTEGSGGLGGSIHLTNIPDWSSRINIRGLLETGSFQSRKSFLQLMGGSSRFQSNTRFFYETAENDFSFFNSGVIPHKKDTLENADYRKGGFLQEFYFRSFSDDIYTLRFWGQKNERNLPQLMSYEGSSREEFQHDTQFRSQFDWKKYTNGLNYHFFTGVHSNRLHYYRATPEYQFVNEDSESREISFLNHFRIFRDFNSEIFATVSFDVNYHRVNVFEKKLDRGYREERLETSFLVNLHLKPSERLAAFVLVRSETYDKKSVAMIPSAGIEWQPFMDWPVTLRSNISRNYHKPTLNDLYWLPGGNPDLLPEDGYSGDISLWGEFNFGNTRLKSEMTGFLSKIDNWIIWQPALNGAFYWEAQNVRDVLSRGIEYTFSSEYVWKKIHFRSGGNYAFTNTYNLDAARSVDKSRGKQLIYIPKNKGQFYFSIVWNHFILKYDINFVGKRFTKSSNIETDYERVLNPYWLNNIAFGKQVEWDHFRINLNFKVENLLNENYQSILWRPMPGRFYSLSVELNFKK